MGNLKKRIERLEERKRKGINIIIAQGGETCEEALQRYKAANPESKGGINLIIGPAPVVQDSPSGPPPRPQPPDPPKVEAQGCRPLQISR